MQVLVAQLLSILDQAYDHRSWHGTNLRGSIRGMSSGSAAWRPAAERHNVWEIVVHAAYWKYVVCRRLTGSARGGFPLKGSNWFAREGQDEPAWQADLALLTRMHRELRAAVGKLEDAALSHTPGGGKESVAALVTGIAAHDLYHAGQIQLIKRLQPR